MKPGSKVSWNNDDKRWEEEKERIERINKELDNEKRIANRNGMVYADDLGLNNVGVKITFKNDDDVEVEKEEDKREYPILKLTDAGDGPDEYHGYCPKCGEYLDDEDNFCSNCGQPLRWDTSEIKKKLGKSEARIKMDEKNNKEKYNYLDFANRINGLMIGIVCICNKFKDDIPNLDFDNIDIQIKREHYDGNVFTSYDIDIGKGDIYTSMDMNLDDGTGGITIESKKINQDYKPIKAQKILKKKK